MFTWEEVIHEARFKCVTYRKSLMFCSYVLANVHSMSQACQDNIVFHYQGSTLCSQVCLATCEHHIWFILEASQAYLISQSKRVLLSKYILLSI